MQSKLVAVLSVLLLTFPAVVEAKSSSCTNRLKATIVDGELYTAPIKNYREIIKSYHQQIQSGIHKRRIRLSTAGVIGQDLRRLYDSIANDRDEIIGNYTNLVHERGTELSRSEKKTYRFNPEKNIEVFAQYYDEVVAGLKKMINSEEVLYHKYYNFAGGAVGLVSYKSSSGTRRQLKKMKDYVIPPLSLESLREFNNQLYASEFMLLPYLGPLSSEELADFYAYLVSPIWHPFHWATLDGQEQSPDEARQHDEQHTDILDSDLHQNPQGTTLRERVVKYKEFRNWLKGRNHRKQALFHLIWFFLPHEFIDIEDESALTVELYGRVSDPKDFGAEFGNYHFTKKEIKAALDVFAKEIYPIQF